MPFQPLKELLNVDPNDRLLQRILSDLTGEEGQLVQNLASKLAHLSQVNKEINLALFEAKNAHFAECFALKLKYQQLLEINKLTQKQNFALSLKVRQQASTVDRLTGMCQTFQKLVEEACTLLGLQDRGGLLEALKQQLTQQSCQSKSIMQQLAQRLAELDRCRLLLAGRQEELCQNRMELDYKQAVLARCGQELQTKKLSSVEKEIELSQCRKENDSRRLEMEIVSQNAGQRQAELAQYIQEKCYRQAELSRCKQQLLQQRQAKADFEKKVEAAQQQLAALQKSDCDKSAKFLELQQRLVQLGDNLCKERESSQHTVSELQLRQQELEKERMNLETKLNHCQQLAERRQSQAEQAKKQVGVLTEENRILEDQVARLREQVQNQRLETKRSEQLVLKLEQTIQQSSVRKHKLEEELRGSAQVYCQLQTALRMSTKECERQKERAQNAEAELAACRKSLQQLKDKITRQQEQAKQLAGQIEGRLEEQQKSSREGGFSDQPASGQLQRFLRECETRCFFALCRNASLAAQVKSAKQQQYDAQEQAQRRKEKLERANRLVNWMVSFSKGYDVEGGQLVVREGTYLNRRGRELLQMQSGQPEHLAKLQNHLAVEELAREDQHLREIVLTVKKVMRHYWAR